jgi:hypothetical protein
VKYTFRNETVLEKIGISNSKVNLWKSRGLKISYPMKVNSKFFKSKDGFFVYAADKFFFQLSKEEIKNYTKNPLKFRKDFLRNLKFYTKFYEYLYSLMDKTEKLESKDKTVALLSLLYLFQSAMDHHYYHYDRYLAYEDYPKTPVGYWWNRLKKLYIKATKEKISKTNSSKDFLKLLSLDEEVLKKIKKKLPKTDFSELNRTLETIRLFEKTQEDEAAILYGTQYKESKLLDTGITLWNKVCEMLKKYPLLVNDHASNMRKIIESHPIVGIRKLLYEGIKYFDKDVVSRFENEIKRWL